MKGSKGEARAQAITLDFYDTLVFHRDGRGRGRLLVEYFEARGWRTGPWEHEILYRLFEDHSDGYSPDLHPEARRRYLDRLALRAFRELGIPVSGDEAARHAPSLWEILGPSCFEVFPDVVPVLGMLKSAGLPLVVVSNWHAGLRHFVAELGLSSFLDHVVGSADFGVAKPDPRIFQRASALLGVPLPAILHVGDSLEEDYRGGVQAGCRVVLLHRRTGTHPGAESVIGSLGELATLPAVVGSGHAG
ncbi:MAG: HAD-IA family hydrolase [Gemmatimonadota bacterium]